MLHDDGTPKMEEPDLRIVAFTHFRFEYDQDEELVYWWVATRQCVVTFTHADLAATSCKWLKTSDIAGWAASLSTNWLRLARTGLWKRSC